MLKSIRMDILGALLGAGLLLASLLVHGCSAISPAPTATPTKTLQPTFTPVTPATVTPAPTATPTLLVSLEVAIFLPEGSTALSSQKFDLDGDGEMETLVAYVDALGLGRGIVLDKRAQGTQAYILGNDSELFMFKNDDYDMRVGDVNGDAQTDIVIDGPMGEQGHFLHIVQWDGQRYPVIGRFFSDGDVFLRDTDGDGVSEVIVKSTPHQRARLVSTKVYQAYDTSYELIIDNTDFASGAPDILQFPEQAILHYYQLLERGEFEASYSMLSVPYQQRISYGTWGAFMDYLQMSSVSNIIIEAEDAVQAIITVDLYVHNPATDEWEPRQHTWQLVKEGDTWQLNDSSAFEPTPTPTVTPSPAPTATPVPTLAPTDTPLPAIPTAPPAPTASPAPTHTPVPAATVAPPLRGGSWDMEDGFYQWHSPYEGFTGHVANGWYPLIKVYDPAAPPRFNENKFNLNNHSGERSQEISFDWRSGEMGIFRTITTASGHNYTIEAWAKYAPSETGYDLDLGIDLTGGENFEAETVTWYPWRDMAPNEWIMTSETVRATGDKMTIFLRATHPMAATGGHKPGGNTILDDVSVIDNGP